MSSERPTREEALLLLKEYNKSDSLIKHALAVEAVMRYFARKRGQDEEKWGVIGLVHDLDYSSSPPSTAAKPSRFSESADGPMITFALS